MVKRRKGVLCVLGVTTEKALILLYDRAKYPNVGIPVISTPLTIHVVKYIFTSSINRFIRQDHDVKIFLTS